jgi:hypothetical protein
MRKALNVAVLVAALAAAAYGGAMGIYLGVFLVATLQRPQLDAPGLGLATALTIGVVALVPLAAWVARRVTAWRWAPWTVVGAALVSAVLRVSPWT